MHGLTEIVRTLTSVIGVLTAVSGVIAAFFAIRQYAMQNSQKRADMFFNKWTAWFDSKDGFGIDPDAKTPSILRLLENDDPRLAEEVPWEKEKRSSDFMRRSPSR